ncbi:hypothetical protein PoB_007481400 [Plakobranchus ocellatus]|uniref:Endonuclease/exonuclease/phosphatase domain-containing protein n=1 Tax=Plakobranchus ocellatus TaxID=259542 RepID=A0AAV4DVS6_9GAST|nr:hypothetical protein PoB_007481400 [Plakobranchus ocellatus]
MDTVVQWNIRGCRSNFEELRRLLNRLQLAVVGPAGMQAWGGAVTTPWLHPASSAGWVPWRGGGPPHTNRKMFLRNCSEHWPACCNCHNKPGKRL